ncbi:MAG: hypothetical protein H7X95_08885 [Deltaproteobacteria bacterium]|nr:hypothetical protein [Deltaproteobacteria bacterium]
MTRWNDNCVFCHNVAPNPGLDVARGAFRTTVAELGIACEACHGPGDAHVVANRDPVRRYALHESGAADPTIVNPSRLSPGRAADVCGRCHGQRISDDVAPLLAHGDPFVPGDDLALYSAPLWRDTPLGGQRGIFAARFWDDGTPRLTAYEYQGLLQSACATRGTLTCINCHGMHDGDPRGQIRPSALDDRACTGCHTAYASPAASLRHTHHDPVGAGARCVSCHMPRIVYGVLDSHRSHRIEIPNPVRAIAMGRPDACTLCHVDADRVWAARAWTRLWPAAASASSSDAPEDHLAPRDAIFAGDPIARALAADAIGRAPAPSQGLANVAEVKRVEDSRADILLEVMSGDRYPAVRHLAARALERVLAARKSPVALEARTFDATGEPHERQDTVERLRKRLLLGRQLVGTRIAALRAAARKVDVDIGE